MQARRYILWFPILFGAGALLYYALPFEPKLAYSIVPLLSSVVALRIAWRRGYRFWPWLLALLTLICGFLWTQSYTQLHPVTMLQKEQRITAVTGRVVEISDVPKGYRITLDDVTVEGLSPEQTPQRVRLKLRGSGGEGLLTGQQVALRAGLLAPSGPVMPAAFDFARYFHFKGIGAVGYAIPPVTVMQGAKKGEGGFWMWLAGVRESMSRRVRSQLPEAEGAVAAALMMGDRSAIPKDVNNAMRDTNLSHILAISGMHMALVTGLLFFALRWSLAALPAARYLRQPKKLAAWLALAAGAVYLLLAGFPVSACRAYFMVALVFSAILLDRQIMPMRSLAAAALLLLLINPSYAMQPGFQLSFIATAALIAWYERVRSSADDWFAPEQRSKRTLLYIGGVLMTSLVAEAATAPLVLYHFNSVAVMGLLANLIIMPLVSFLIMPCIVLAFLLWPLGLEGVALAPAGYGIEAMIIVAKWVAAMPYAQMFAPSPPAWGMALATAGILWMIVWRGRIRLWGAAGVAAGMLSLFWVSMPDLLISGDLKQIAGRVDGKLVMLKGRAGGFVSQQWANGAGMATLAAAPKQSEQWRCDALGCIYRSDEGSIVAFPESFQAQAEDCTKAALVVSPFYLRQWECSAPFIDRRARGEGGAHWAWIRGGEITLESSGDVQGQRPWSKGSAD